MTTSMRVDDETKSHPERLQTEVRLKTRTRVAQQEVLMRLVENTVESEVGLIDSFRERRVPLSASERERFHNEMISSGAMTTEEGIDDALHG